MNVALKEWDVQTRALEAGRVAVLVRKGGITEQRGEFSLEHQKFWLYPTFLHQNTAELQGSFHDLLRQTPELGEIELRSFAVVESILKLEDLSLVQQLEPLNALTADALTRKFKYRDKPFVHALLLRVFTCQPVQILETLEYAGCVSWVGLESNIEPVNPQPVLSETAFISIKAKLGVLA